MAQGDLKKLIEDARDMLGQDTEWYRTFLDIQAHSYYNSVENVTAEFIEEVGSEAYRDNKKTFDTLIRNYVATLYERIVKTPRSAYQIVEHPGSGPTSFVVDIIPTKQSGINPKRYSGKTIIYDSTGPNPFKRIIGVEKNKALKPFLDGVNEILGTGLTSQTFLDTGHEGVGVAEKQSFAAVGQIQEGITAREDISQLAVSSGILARLELISRWTGPSKTTIVTVTDESVKGNRGKASGEAAFKASTFKALNKIITETNWATQEGSDSPVTAILKDLDEAVRKSGGKAPNRGKAQRTNGAASTTISYKARTEKITDGGFASTITGGKVNNTFDTSMIALINAQLPPAVRANMGPGSLVNRTGRFAGSAKITGVEKTPQGYPRLVYTYQRAPYDVFDPVLGAPPWNTPNRDPKKLIEKSIRDIARDMAVKRFYVRRQ